MTQILPFLLSGIICGLILFQSFLIAPSINKLINKKDAAILLRYLWPKFFLLIGFISLVSVVLIYVGSMNQEGLKYGSIVSVVLMGVCYAITPIINKAKDNSKDKRWFVLHLSTVLLTLTTLVVNVFIIGCWNF